MLIREGMTVSTHDCRKVKLKAVSGIILTLLLINMLTLVAVQIAMGQVTWTNDAINYRLNYLDCIFTQWGLPQAVIPIAIDIVVTNATRHAEETDGVVDVDDLRWALAEHLVADYPDLFPTMDDAYAAIAECEAVCATMFSDFPVTSEGEEYHVTTFCNSTTISEFQFDEVNQTIRFNVAGEEGIGFCRASIPHDLVEPPHTVTVDGQPPQYVNYTVYDNGTHRWIYFTYQHSTREVIIAQTPPVGGIWIPVNKLSLIAPYIGLTTLLAVAVMAVGYVKKRKRTR